MRIGTVDFVSADEIKVMLDIDAPDSLSLNSGTPRPFPRINGYVLIPSENGYLVGQVVWVTIERSQYPKRKGMQDFGLVDLPYPMRKLSLSPVGTIIGAEIENADKEKVQGYSFRRGVETFPSVGDPVVIPTNEQLISIIQSGKNRRVKIGTSPLADGAEVKVDPDRLFGRHLAVLGNTGSGKSCSVAGLIRWSIEAAQKESTQSKARFVVLDPNGEYSRAFKGFQNAKVFTIEAANKGLENLKIPVWFWNSEEWCAFTQASGKTQRPILRRGLREIRAGKNYSAPKATDEEKLLKLRRYLSSKLVKLKSDLNSDAIKEEESKFGFYLAAVAKDLESMIPENTAYQEGLAAIKDSIETVRLPAFKTFQKGGETIEYYRAFEENAVNQIIAKISDFLQNNGGVIYQEGPGEDCPLEFSGAEFADHVQQIGLEEKASQFIDFLVMRIRALLADTRMQSIITPPKELTLETWLSEYIGNSKENNGTITIIDLSLVPSEVVHILTTVIARMTFEALQRYRRQHKEQKVLPTVLVMEEAHNFIRRYSENSEIQDAASTCCRLFERIAREGRKFGLGLVLSSQRPSELSPTVLSQCNTFLLHRISNDKDQELVHKLIPDNLRGLLRDLPSLPSQNALLLGWASELPVLVRMNDLPSEHQPQSDDPDFWDVWTGKEPRDVDWKEIADQWQNNVGDTTTPEADEEEPLEDPFA
jgi:hypothetical protein